MQIEGTRQAFEKLISERGVYKCLGVERSTVSTWKIYLREGKSISLDKMEEMLFRSGAQIVKSTVWRLNKHEEINGTGNKYQLRMDNILYDLELREYVRFDPYIHVAENHYYVPLDEEWLLKFGWDRESESISLPESEGLIISENNCTTVRLMDTAGNYLSKSFTYVHELQNLYFGVTGEELEIKTKV